MGIGLSAEGIDVMAATKLKSRSRPAKPERRKTPTPNQQLREEFGLTRKMLAHNGAV